MMKKYIRILLVMMAVGMTATAASAQNVDEIFSEFASESEATCVKVNPFMMWFGKAFMGGGEDARIARKVTSVRVLDIEDCGDAVKARFRSRMDGLAGGELEELVRVNDEGEKVRVFAHIDKDKIRKMLVLCDDDCTLVEINGKFDMNDLSGVIDSQVPKHNGSK